jgi:hypothetical protein
VIECRLKISKSLKTEFSAIEHLEEREFLKDILTTKESLGVSEWELKDE